MPDFSLYEPETGRLVSSGEVSSHESLDGLADAFPDFKVVEERVLDIDAHYVSGDRVRPRPELNILASKTAIVADGYDRTVLTGFPSPCEIEIDGATATLPNGELTLTADTAAFYTIRCKHWPYRDWEGVIEAREMTS